MNFGENAKALNLKNIENNGSNFFSSYRYDLIKHLKVIICIIIWVNRNLSSVSEKSLKAILVQIYLFIVPKIDIRE